MSVCLLVRLFITRAPILSWAAEPGREKESLVLCQGLLGKWWWDGEVEKKKERNSRRDEGDFPGGPLDKTPCFQCRGPEFDPWSGNYIPHALTKSWYSQKILKTKKKKKRGREGGKEGHGGRSEKLRLSWLHLQPGHQGQSLSSEGVLPLAWFLYGLDSTPQTLGSVGLESWGQNSRCKCDVQ